MDPLIALPESFVRLRQKSIAEIGARAMDVQLAMSTCRPCGQTFPTAMGANSVCGFASYDAFRERAAQIAAEMARRPASPCKTCGGARQISSVLYFSHHGGLKRDFVLEWRPKPGLFAKPVVEVLWWEPSSGMQPGRPLTPDEEAHFVRDCAFREGQAAFEMGDASHGMSVVERLAAKYPADPDLICFVPLMLARGFARVGAQLVAAHLERWPDDADALHWKGEVLFRSIAHRIEPESRLPEARAAFDRSLSLRPGHLPTQLARCNVLRGEKKDAEAAIGYRQILAVNTGCAEAQFNLGAMLIESVPEEALGLFQSGERLQPKDPDYPVGAARALLRLGRRAEAREALARAKQLAPKHPRYAELEAQLAAN